LKFSLETAPGQRPHGVLGIWSPILSAVGNAFKIQVSCAICVINSIVLFLDKLLHIFLILEAWKTSPLNAHVPDVQSSMWCVLRFHIEKGYEI
jgi:hypothetical protein